LAEWIEEYVRDGWDPYLLTFMFRQLGGSNSGVARQMEREVERVYTTFVTHVVRRPRALSALGRLPIWWCSHDLPVHKRGKSSLRDASINGGRHMHAIALQPPWSRLREDLNVHFEEERHRYLRPGCALERIDVEAITHAAGYVAKYARKSVDRGRVAEATDLILPRALSELSRRVDRIQPGRAHSTSALLSSI
jgi:hypothetical protein